MYDENIKHLCQTPWVVIVAWQMRVFFFFFFLLEEHVNCWEMFIKNKRSSYNLVYLVLARVFSQEFKINKNYSAQYLKPQNRS